MLYKLHHKASQFYAPEPPAMKASPFLRALLTVITVSQCRADIPWKTYSCAGKSVGGASIPALWDNAKLMTSRAIARINEAREARAINPVSDTSAAANNCKWMWGTKHDWTRSMKDEDKQKLNQPISKLPQSAGTLGEF